MANEHVVEHFFGVYLLYCKNPNYKGKTYIGYTVDPLRRIKQHNAGKNFGGAWKTSNRRPWEMILIVHGFPNATSALRFEWAWQHPKLSRRLKHVPKKKYRQKAFDYCLVVLSEMLNLSPWLRLPLTIRWLDDDFGKEYSARLSPPIHMPITYSKVISKKLKNVVDSSNKIENAKMSKNKTMDSSIEFCSICSMSVEFEDRIICVQPNCALISHIICLAELFRKDDKILPIDGFCPVCTINVLWGDLIRKKIGCTMHFNEEANDDDSYCSEN